MSFISDDLLITLGNLVALIVTILILSYAFADGPPFRIAIYIFIGVSAGYVGGVSWHAIIRPQLIDPLLNLATTTVSKPQLFFTALLTGLMITKLSSRTAVLGNPVSAFIIGIGAAAAIGGTIQGTLLPLITTSSSIISSEAMQVSFTSVALSGVQFLFTVTYMFGTIATLIYFHFSAKTPLNQTAIRNPIIEFVARVGQFFIAVTFGTIFSGALLASLIALIERLNFIRDIVSSFIFGQ